MVNLNEIIAEIMEPIPYLDINITRGNCEMCNKISPVTVIEKICMKLDFRTSELDCQRQAASTWGKEKRIFLCPVTWPSFSEIIQFDRDCRPISSPINMQISPRTLPWNCLNLWPQQQWYSPTSFISSCKSFVSLFSSTHSLCSVLIVSKPLM